MAKKDKHEIEMSILGGKKVVSTNKKIAKSINTIARASRRLNSNIMRSGNLMGTQALGLVTVGLAIRKVIRSYGDYDDSLAKIRTTLSSTNDQLGNTASKASGLAEIMSRRLAFSVTESNEAMNTLLQTGIGTQRAMRVYETGLQLSRVAEMDTGDAMQFMVDSMNAFNTERMRGGEGLRDFSRRMVSQLSVAANSAATSMGQLQNAFRYAGGEMAGFGYKSHEVIAALASMSVGGIRGSSAGTRLRGAIAALHSVTPRTERVFKQFGISAEELSQTFYDAEGNRRPLQDGMRRMGSIFRRVRSEVGKNQALLRLYGRRALIAGMSLSDMGKIAEKFHEIMGKFEGAEGFEQLAEDIRSGAVIDRQAEQRMQSFGVQVEQTKHAVEELAIGFGEILFAGLKKGNEGFGTYLRNLAGNMRLARLGKQRTAEQTTEWNRLSEAERESAKELLDFLTTTADAIKMIGEAIVWIGRFISEHKSLIKYLAIAGIVMHIMLGAVRAVGSIAAGSAAAIFVLGGAVLTATNYFQDLASTGIRETIAKLLGLDEQLNEVANTAGGRFADSIRSIPLIGPLLAQWGRLVGILELAWKNLKKLTGLGKAFDDQETLETGATATRRREFSGADQIMESYRSRVVRSGGRLTEQGEQQFAAQEKNRAISRLATTQIEWYERQKRELAAGRTTESGIREQLAWRMKGAGISRSSEAFNITDRVLRALGDANIEDTRREAERLGVTSENTAESLQTFIRQIGQLNRVIANPLALGNSGDILGLDSAPMTMMQDGYVRRGGIAGVSTGDIVVSRSHLADAVSGSRGSMVPALTGQSQSTVQPPGGSGGGTTSVQADVPIILQLDGAEIARAVGKVHLRHIERSGTTIQPGQRRTLAESGFSESRR